MTDTDQEREDEVLRRMLKTKPTPHKTKSHPHVKTEGLTPARVKKTVE